MTIYSNLMLRHLIKMGDMHIYICHFTFIKIASTPFSKNGDRKKRCHSEAATARRRKAKGVAGRS